MNDASAGQNRKWRSGYRIGDPVLLLWLAVSDLCHEWLLSVCLILSIAAVSAPLLTLYGLKRGVIETMRNRLVQDCRIREITPQGSLALSKQWFSEITKRADVAFIVPATRQISLGVEGSLKGGIHIEAFDLMPTETRDPLIVEHTAEGVAALKANECVLSAEFGRKIGAAEGGLLTVYVKRVRPGADRPQISSLELYVRGILSPAATTRSVCLVTLPVAEAVESYRDGHAVRRYGWDGDVPRLQPEFDGIAIAGAVSPELSEKIVHSSSCTTITKLSANQVRDLFPFARDMSIITVFESVSGGVNLGVLKRVAEALTVTREPMAYLPYVRPLNAEIETETEERQKIQVMSTDIDGFLKPDTPISEPSTDFSKAVRGYGTGAITRGSQIVFEANESRIEIPISVSNAPDIPVGPNRNLVYVPWRIAGLLRATRNVSAEVDVKSGTFLRTRSNYAGFRLYARSIDDVENIRDALEAQGIAVYTQLDKIADVKTIDHNLGILIAVLGSLAVAGCFGVLLSTLFSSIERKIKPLSVLRLLGISAPKLCLIPVYQSTIAVVSAFLISLGAYLGCGSLIDRIFRAGLREGESFCRIPLPEIFMFLMCALLFAWIISLLTLPRLQRMSISENIRDE